MLGCLGCTGHSNASFSFDLSHIEIEDEDIFPINYHGLRCISCERLKVWKTIIHDIHALYIGCLLEAYDKIPIEVYEYLKRDDERYWLGVIYNSKMNIIEKNRSAIYALIEKGAKKNKMGCDEYISRWSDPLYYLTGRCI